VKFLSRYSIQKDIQNHFNSVWRFRYRKYGRRNIKSRLIKAYLDKFKEEIKGAGDKKEAERVVRKFIISLHSKKIAPIIKDVEKVLNDGKDEIISDLEQVYQKRWFMSGIGCSPEKHILIAKHELNHFMFYYYYSDKLRKIGLSEDKIEAIKESLAVLTSRNDNNKPSLKIWKSLC